MGDATSVKNVSDALLDLEKLNWIDSKTRALFIQYSLYNPNINLFSFCNILFELLPTGNLIKSAQFYSINLFESGTYSLLDSLFGVFFMVFIVFFMIKEIRIALKQGYKDYLKQFWVYVEWTMFAFSWASFSIYFYKLYAKNDLTKRFKNKEPINLQMLSYWNDLFEICLGFVSFFGILKFLKLLRFNSVICCLAHTLRLCLNDVPSLGFIFFVLWTSFVQIIYLIFYQKSQAFSTIVKTFESTFTIILGNLNKDLYNGQNSAIGILASVFFNLSIVFVLVNLIVSIITENFDLVRKDTSLTEQDSEIINYLVEKSKLFLGILNPRNLIGKEAKTNAPKYIDKMEIFDLRIDKLIDKL